MCDSKIALLLSQLVLNGDGTGFWDSYDGEIQWLGCKVQISIAARSICEEIALLYEKVMTAQAEYDALWKEFAVEELWNGIQQEMEEKLTKREVVEELQITDLTFGFDRDGLMSVWIIGPFQEHAPCVYCNQAGIPYAAAMEG